MPWFVNVGRACKAGLSQEAVAELMVTTNNPVSRLEAAGKHAPSMTTLKKYTQAVGGHLEIKLVPDERSAQSTARTARKRASG